jgi:hypothetical protein
MRYLATAVVAILLSGPAFAESFNFSGGQVVTHRDSNVTLVDGTNVIGKKSDEAICNSASCSLLIQTRFDITSDKVDIYTLCTFVDNVSADPVCIKRYIFVTDAGGLTSFQGVPNLAHGRHKITTKIDVETNGDGAQINIADYQIVYTLYEHQ